MVQKKKKITIPRHIIHLAMFPPIALMKKALLIQRKFLYGRMEKNTCMHSWEHFAIRRAHETAWTVLRPLVQASPLTSPPKLSATTCTSASM